MTITEFLNARLDEDEAVARAGMSEPAYPHYGDTAAHETLEMALNEGCAEEGAAHFRRWLPARVLAEVEAKRDLMAMADPNDYWDDGGNGMSAHADDILRHLALPYADHPDYDEAWRV